MYVRIWIGMPCSKDYFCNQNIELPASIFFSARRYGYIYWKNLCVRLLIESISNYCARSIQTDA